MSQNGTVYEKIHPSHPTEGSNVVVTLGSTKFSTPVPFTEVGLSLRIFHSLSPSLWLRCVSVSQPEPICEIITTYREDDVKHGWVAVLKSAYFVCSPEQGTTVLMDGTCVWVFNHQITSRTEVGIWYSRNGLKWTKDGTIPIQSCDINR